MGSQRRTEARHQPFCLRHAIDYDRPFGARRMIAEEGDNDIVQMRFRPLFDRADRKMDRTPLENAAPLGCRRLLSCMLIVAGDGLHPQPGALQITYH